MKRKQTIVLLTIAALTYSQITAAKNENCWAELYESASFSGAKVRLQGPVNLSTLKNIDGQNWDRRIDSIKLGKDSKLTVFENHNFKLTLTEMANYPRLMKSLGVTERDILEDSELIFDAGDNIHNLGDFNFSDRIRSLKLECK